MSGWMDVCLDVVKLFQIATPPTVFVWFLQKSAHMIYVPVQKINAVYRHVNGKIAQLTANVAVHHKISIKS